MNLECEWTVKTMGDRKMAKIGLVRLAVSVTGLILILGLGIPANAAGPEPSPSSSQGKKGSRPPIKAETPTGPTGSGAEECKKNGGEWRCTTVSTGSKPGPEDDIISCVCNRSK